MIELTAASTTKLPPTLRDENRRLHLLQESQAGTIRSLMDEVSRLSGELREGNQDCDRYRNRIFLLDGAIANLKDEVADLEKERDELQTQIDDPEHEEGGGLEEPPRPEEPGNQFGLNPAPGLGGGGGP